VLSVQSLGSGSSGNALLIEEEGALLLVDCGIGARAMAAGLRAVGRRLVDLDALLLTHEHADHVRALPQVVRAGVPVVATRGTAAAAGVTGKRHEQIRGGTSLAVAGLTVTALPLCHDAAEPCGFHIEGRHGSILVATDLGCAAGGWGDRLAAADLIVLEANHDELLLRTGPYPAHLKRRVLSERGHLSNAACGAFLAEAFAANGHRSPTVWLAHLSQTNNRPALARETVLRSLAARGFAPLVLPLPRHAGGPTWRFGDDRSTPIQLPLLFGERLRLERGDGTARVPEPSDPGPAADYTPA